MHEEIAHRIEAVGGVESVGVSSCITMDGNSNNDPIWVEDFPEADTKIPALRRMKYIGARYFETMGNPVIAGRDFTWADVHNAAPVALLSENLAREYWGEPAKAIGKRMRRTSKTDWIEIVGVVGNERQDGATKPAPPIDLLADASVGSRSAASRSCSDRSRMRFVRHDCSRPGFLAEVQQAVWSVNPNLPLARVRTLQQIYNESMAQTSFVLVILGIAASVTLLLGLVGIYGVIAYIVSQRRREVGIRMALGAHSGEVQRMFVSRGLILTGVGLIVGLVAAAALMRLMSSLLFGVNPFDPITYATVVAGIGYGRRSSPRGCPRATRRGSIRCWRCGRSTGCMQPPETLVLSDYDLRTDAIVVDTDRRQRRIFEGAGVASSWTLELPREVNEIDYGSLIDVRLTFTYQARYDPEPQAAGAHGAGRPAERPRAPAAAPAPVAASGRLLRVLRLGCPRRDAGGRRTSPPSRDEPQLTELSLHGGHQPVGPGGGSGAPGHRPERRAPSR